MNNLLALALLTLFIAFQVQTDLVLIRPFDGLVVLILVLTLLNRNFREQDKLPVGFLILLPYFFWHVFSATTVSLENGLREGLQVGVATVFALTLAVQMDRIDYPKLGRLMLIGLVLITAYNIYWHIDQGFWSGWKQLIDPKRAFSFLPLVVGCLLLFSAGQARKLYWLLWAALGVVILFSGERKALVIYLILSAALAARGRLLVAIPVITTGILLLGLIGSMINDTYLQRQVRSILNPIGSTLSLPAIATGEMPESLSNTQRVFALELSMEMFAQHPIVGVGTNAYQDIVVGRYAYLPKFMQIAPHGEFLRILTENGLIGLMLYVFVWGSAFVRLRRTLRRLTSRSVITRGRASVLQIVLMVPAFLHVSFEAAGTHSFVILIMVSLLPEFCNSALLGQRRKRGLQSKIMPAYLGRERRAHAQ